MPVSSISITPGMKTRMVRLESSESVEHSSNMHKSLGLIDWYEGGKGREILSKSLDGRTVKVGEVFIKICTAQTLPSKLLYLLLFCCCISLQH